MNQTLENPLSDVELRETLLAVRAKLKIALHLARDRAERRISLRRVR